MMETDIFCISVAAAWNTAIFRSRSRSNISIRTLRRSMKPRRHRWISTAAPLQFRPDWLPIKNACSIVQIPYWRWRMCLREWTPRIHDWIRIADLSSRARCFSASLKWRETHISRYFLVLCKPFVTVFGQKLHWRHRGLRSHGANGTRTCLQANVGILTREGSNHD